MIWVRLLGVAVLLYVAVVLLLDGLGISDFGFGPA